jgi:putative flippase GtrA
MPQLSSPILDRLTRTLPARHHQLAADFLRFGMVGAIGFCFDTGTVYALSPWIGLYLAGFASYFVAATVNWVLNRIWTFRHRVHAAAHLQWARFLAVNLIGFVLNRGAYAILIATTLTAREYPVLAVAAGAFSGLALNFFLSRRIVFR